MAWVGRDCLSSGNLCHFLFLFPLLLFPSCRLLSPLALGMRGRGVRPPFHGMGVIHGVGGWEVSGQIEGHSACALSTLQGDLSSQHSHTKRIKALKTIAALEGLVEGLC